MNHFSIFAHGKNFDPDEYLKQAIVEFDDVWHRGDTRGCAEFVQDHHKTSGVKKFLGNGQELSIYDQDRIASEFLDQHESALADLARYPGVDAFILGLHYRQDLAPNLRGFCMSPSARLMYYVLRTRVDLNFYIDLVPTDEWKDC